MMMNVSKALCISTLLLAAGFGFEALAEVPRVDEMLKPKQGSYRIVSPSQPETADRMEWFREAKFGMMIHWGIYSTRGGISPDGSPQKAKYTEWYQSANKLSYAKYSKLAKEFNPVEFDAEEWVRIAKDAGMKYITITSKHHDGFCLFDSAHTEYDIMDATPFKRDVLMELREACDKEGLKLCFYYSHAQDWEQYDAWHTPRSAFPEKRGTPQDHEKYLTGKALPQVEELCTRYRADGFWFDTPWFNKERKIPNLSISKRFSEVVRKHRLSAVINSRISYGAIAGTKNLDTSLFDYLSLKDQGIPSGKLPLYAESPDSIHHSYGYDARPDVHYRTGEELIGRMARVIAGDGNYLLNIGPTGEGNLPARAVNELKVVGEWMKRNGEAVYGTEGNPFPNPERGNRKTSIPMTTKGNRLYVFCETGQDAVTLPGLESTVVKAWVLGSSNTVDFKQTKGKVTLQLPSDDDSLMPVIAVECDGDRIVVD
jgi:alpha-L-fucosidase